MPKSVVLSKKYPLKWPDERRRWNSWYDTADYPRIVNPPDGVIVTANNRIVSGQYLAMLGDGGYDPGARARQILNGVRTDKKVGEARSEERRVGKECRSRWWPDD